MSDGRGKEEVQAAEQTVITVLVSACDRQKTHMQMEAVSL